MSTHWENNPNDLFSPDYVATGSHDRNFLAHGSENTTLMNPPGIVSVSGQLHIRSYHGVSQPSMSMTVPTTLQDLHVIQTVGTASHETLLQSSNPHYSRLFLENMMLKVHVFNER
jgi:hypothetical protein